MINLYIVDNKASRSSVYGIGTYINQLAISLIKNDIHVNFIHLNSEALRFFTKIENGVTHWNIPSPKMKYKDEEKHNNFYFKNVSFILRQNIKQTDNLIFHINYTNCKPLADVLKASFNCKIVLTVHYFSWCFDMLGNISRFRNLIGKPESKLDNLGKQVKKSFNDEKESLCFVDKVLSLSKHDAKIIQQIYKVKKQNISIIPNGLEDKAQKGFDRELIRRKYYLPVNTQIIIFAGRLDPVKGLSFLINALKNVLNKYPDCHLVVAGSGDFDTCMKVSSNRWMNIHFTGLLEKKELYELYSIADIGVMSSLYEPFGYVAIEMMMHGLPVIVTKTGGLNEIVEDGISGLKVQVRTIKGQRQTVVKQLEEKICLLLENPGYAKEIGENGRKRFLEKFELSIFKEKMLNLYNNL